MTAEVQLFPDTEHAVRQWLRGLDLPGVGTAVFFTTPERVPTGVFVTVSRVGGGPAIGEVLLDVARLGVQVWGDSKKAAGDAARDVAAHLRALEGDLLIPGVVCHGAEVGLILWQPSPETARPRYIVDVTVTAQQVA